MKSTPLTTRSTHFGRVNPVARDLFAVAANVEIGAALDRAGELLEAATDVVQSVANRIKRADGAAELCGAVHILGSVAALIDATISWIDFPDRSPQTEGDPCEVFPLALSADELAVVHRWLDTTDPAAVEAWATNVIKARLAALTHPTDPRALFELGVDHETIKRLQRVADEKHNGDLGQALSARLEGDA